MGAVENDPAALATLVGAIAIVVGIVGVVVPVLPGLVLCWAGVLVWVLLGDAGWGKWVVLGVATALAAAGTVIKYLVPGRRLKEAGVPNRSLAFGGILGIIGFFVVPVVGLVLGFVLGVWAAEQHRLRDKGQAWASTVHALKATGLSMLIELGTGLSIGVAYAAGVVAA
jgi:uncharacterized protein YqgC (DUF456 family)